MQIVMVATEFASFKDSEGLGGELAALATGLKKAGNTVHVVIPMYSGTDPSNHSLAKRLRPIELETGRWHRFDGQNPSGVQIHLLEREEKRDPVEGFGEAAAAAVTAIAQEGCGCLSFGTTCFAVPALAPRSEKGTAITHRLVAVDADPGFPTGGDIAPVVWGRGLADRIREDSTHPLAGPVSSGEALVVSKAAGVSFSAATDTTSTKASFQVEAGLPVRPEVPLFFFAKPDPDVLESLLPGDVQAAARISESDENLEALRDRYPDRLTLVVKGDLMGKWLRAADFCVSLDSASDAMASVAAGTVPVVRASTSEGLADLETSLESGAAITVGGDTRREILEALQRCQGAFARREAFAALRRRLPGFARTSAHQADLIVSSLTSS